MDEIKTFFSTPYPYLGFGVAAIVGVWWFKMTSSTANMTLVLGVLAVTVAVFLFLPRWGVQPTPVRILWTITSFGALSLAAYYGLWTLPSKEKSSGHDSGQSSSSGTATPLGTLSESQLARIEFQTESAKTLREVRVIVSLNRPYSPDELGHFRILFEIVDFDVYPEHPTLWLACSDHYPVFSLSGKDTKVFGVHRFVWSRNPDDLFESTLISEGGFTAIDRFPCGSELFKKGPYKTLDDLDRKSLNVYVTENLLDKISSLSLVANNYILISKDAAVFKPLNKSDPLVDWPEPLSEAQKGAAWRPLMLRDLNGPLLNEPEAPSPWILDFSKQTPVKQEK